MSAIEAFDDWPNEDTSSHPVDADEAHKWVERKLERIAQLRAERRRMQIVADDLRARADLYEKRDIAQQDRAIAFHEDAVKGWMLGQLEANPRRASYPFPSGRVQSRKLADKIEIDPEQVPALLHSRPDLARRVPERFELDKHALNEAVAAGEEFDGVTVETARVSITIVTDGTE